MKIKRFLSLAGAALLATGFPLVTFQTRAADTLALEANPNEPMMLDLARYYGQWFITPDQTNARFAGIAGRPVIDGLPFDVRGRGCVFGEKEFNWNRADSIQPNGKPYAYPDFTGIVVGRKFEELHLLHACRWADVQGRTIAFIRLNYDDGTAFEFPIRYGVQVRDWQRLLTEESETITDPHTKIIWRNNTPTALKGTERMFKTTLVNPLPDKLVATIDVISTRHFAAYEVTAATVANHDASRPVTPAVPSIEPERTFDGACVVTVVDADSGQRLAGAVVDPAMAIEGMNVIASPLFTDEQGVAIIRYPKGRVENHCLSAEKEGYGRSGSCKQGSFEDAVTLRLSKVSDAPVPGKIIAAPGVTPPRQQSFFQEFIQYLNGK